MTKVLVIGAGADHTLRIKMLQPGETQEKACTFEEEFDEVVRVDISPAHQPDVVWDLTQVPWPFKDSEFDAVHGYEVLEHLSRAGDVDSFFRIWRELYRVLKDGGVVCATVPQWFSMWAWCDPGHGVVYTPLHLTYLMQGEYEKQVGHGAMSDYRNPYWPPPFNFLKRFPTTEEEGYATPSFMFVVQKIPWVREECESTQE